MQKCIRFCKGKFCINIVNLFIIFNGKSGFFVIECSCKSVKFDLQKTIRFCCTLRNIVKELIRKEARSAGVTAVWAKTT